MKSRKDKVEALARAAFNGMLTEGKDATGPEVISACLTVALWAIEFTKTYDEANATVLRNAVGQLWAALPTEKQQVN